MERPHQLNRREFLYAAGAVASTAAIGMQPARTFAQQAPAAAMEEWFDKPMRWMQLVLVENDPVEYDPKFWLDFFRRSHIDAINLSAGGCIAYYPSKIPFHHVSTFMKEGTDPFGDLVKGCREQGMVVIARTDSHSILDDAAKAHPEWLAVEASGNPRRHWADPKRWVTCAYGPYNFEFMTEVHREIVTNYDVDGIFTNRWQGSGMCYCESCKKLFKDYSGFDLPRGGGNPEVSRKYTEWTNQRLFELWRLWDGEIRKIKPHARYIANSGGGSMTSMDMVTISQLAPTLFADRQSRRGDTMAPWANGKTGKEFRATFGRKPIVGISSLGIDDDHRWKDSVINEPELRIWVAEGVANGLRPWIVKFCGVIHDPRWVPVVEKIFAWQYANEKYLRNEQNLARVAMVYSQQTGTFYGGNQKRAKVEDHENGMYQALIEARVPFEMVHDRLLTPDGIDRYKLLILPNIAALSDAQCNQFRQYVTRGGSILATFETSLYDELGNPRPNFGLADLFGVDYAGNVQRGIKNSYMHIEKQTNHPVLRGLENAGRIINTVARVEVKPVADFGPPPLTNIPSYPDLPMEEVYPRIKHTDNPEIFMRQVGLGRVVYFPGDIDRTFWEVLATDHGTLLRNAIAWATNETPPVVVTGQGMFDTTIWRQKGSMTVHLVNLTNPMMMKAPYRELIPSPPQEVAIKLPPSTKAQAVRLLVAGTSPTVQEENGTIRLKIDSVLDHETIAIDL